MSIEESRKRRAEQQQQAQAKKQPQQPTAQNQQQTQAKPPLDLEVIRQAIREVVAAELRPIKTELQTIGHVLAILSQEDQESTTSQRPQWLQEDGEEDYSDGDQGETQEEEQERGNEAAPTWNVLPARPAGQQRHRQVPQEPEPIMLTVRRPGERGGSSDEH